MRRGMRTDLVILKADGGYEGRCRKCKAYGRIRWDGKTWVCEGGCKA